MRLVNYLQHFTKLLFFELVIQFLLYVDQMIEWICHPNLFLGILNGTCTLPLMPGNDHH
jgi:hypothetical protein